MTKRVISILISVLTVCAFITHTVYADNKIQVPDRPVNSTIYDPSDYIDKKDEIYLNQLNRKMSKLDKKLQIGYVIVDTIGNQSIESFSNLTARKWKVGFNDNNGILIVVSIHDRKFRIETSNNVSTIITDSISSKIQQNVKSYFIDKQYSNGIVEMTQQLIYRFYGEDSQSILDKQIYQNQADIYQKDENSSMFEILIFIMILLVVMSNKLSRRKSSSLINDLLISSFILSNSSSNHSSNSSHDSSSSWSGGGFDGGGSSGSW